MVSKRLAIQLTLFLQFFIRTCFSEYFDGIYFEKFAFNILEEGNPFQTKFTKVFIQCIDDCSEIPDCLSLNVAVQRNNDGLYECMLLRNETLGAHGLLTPSQSFHHYSRRLEDKCSIPRCKNGGTCEIIGNDFRCRCPQGWTGKLCTICDINDSPALGMESGAIPDSSISASSYFHTGFLPHYARLHGLKQWVAFISDHNQWLQVDLSTVTMVTHIATQGGENWTYWVKTYSLQYGSNGSYFEDYEGGKILTGNNDRSTVVKNALQPAITARYIRVLPKTGYYYRTLRMELYGCRPGNEE